MVKGGAKAWKVQKEEDWQTDFDLHAADNLYHGNRIPRLSLNEQCVVGSIPK